MSTMTYVLTCGEYSEHGVLGAVIGPPGVTQAALVAQHEAFRAAKRAFDATRETPPWPGPFGPGDEDRRVEHLIAVRRSWLPFFRDHGHPRSLGDGGPTFAAWLEQHELGFLEVPVTEHNVGAWA